MKPKFIKSFVVKCFLGDVTNISFSYNNRIYFLTCAPVFGYDSEVNLLVRVYCIFSCGAIDYLFCSEFRGLTIDNIDIKSLVSVICEEIENKK